MGVCQCRVNLSLSMVGTTPSSGTWTSPEMVASSFLQGAGKSQPNGCPSRAVVLWSHPSSGDRIMIGEHRLPACRCTHGAALMGSRARLLATSMGFGGSFVRVGIRHGRNFEWMYRFLSSLNPTFLLKWGFTLGEKCSLFCWLLVGPSKVEPFGYK